MQKKSHQHFEKSMKFFESVDRAGATIGFAER
jgi:hypothetical protein